MSTSAQPSAQQPLAGVKILEFSTMITCAVAAMMLSAQGAEVIKVEPSNRHAEKWRICLFSQLQSGQTVAGD